MPRMTMYNPRRVILLIESSRAVGRSCLFGIASYIRNHGSWQILHLEHSVSDELPKVVRQWKGDGVVSRISNEKMARSVARLRLPVVDIRGAHRIPGCASLATDSAACAKLAAEHFLERGFRHSAATRVSTSRINAANISSALSAPMVFKRPSIAPRDAARWFPIAASMRPAANLPNRRLRTG